MIDPVWNETAANDANFKQVMLDIYSKQHLEITPLPDAYGFDILTRAVKNAAVSRTPKDTHLSYLAQSRPDYSGVVRISSLEALDCWYGFIYTTNQSQYTLRESLTLELEGLELIHTDGKTYQREGTKE